MAMDTTQGEQAGLLQFIAAEKENLRREREALALERLRLQRGEQPGLNGQHHPDERREVQVQWNYMYIIQPCTMYNESDAKAVVSGCNAPRS